MKQQARTRFAVVMVAIAAVALGVAYLLLRLIGPSWHLGNLSGDLTELS